MDADTPHNILAAKLDTLLQARQKIQKEKERQRLQEEAERLSKHYEFLEVHPSVSNRRLDDAYKKLMLKFSPEQARPDRYASSSDHERYNRLAEADRMPECINRPMLLICQKNIQHAYQAIIMSRKS